MVCDTRLKPGQLVSERISEVKRAVARLEAAIQGGPVKLKVGPTGAVAIQGWNETERDGITDACAFRRLLATGSPALRREIVRAEAEAGRQADRQVIGSGVHSHDGVRTWHHGH